MTHRFGAFALLASAMGCTGVITDAEPAAGAEDEAMGLPPGSGGGSIAGGGKPGGGQSGGGPGGIFVPEPGAAIPGLAPLRRLTNAEYTNTVHDLLGDTAGVGQGFSPDLGNMTRPIGYDSVLATNNFVGVDSARQYLDAAEVLARTAVAARLQALLPCDPAAPGEAACARQFIDSFGQRAYRRPLEAADKAALLSIYEYGQAQGGFTSGIEMVITAALSSPNFLYRVEAPRSASGIENVSDYEFASRLSYALWRSMPDDALFASAEAGKLRTKDGAASETTRMLQDPKAAQAMKSFYSQWFRLYAIDTATKDPMAFPAWSNDIQTLMKTEAETLFGDILSSSGDVTQLLTAKHTFVNAKLAKFYGFPAVTGDKFQRVELGAQYAAGAMRLGAVQAGLAHGVKTAPFVRSKFILDMVICQPLPPVPANANQNFTVTPAVTTRQVLETKTSADSCQACHKIMNPFAWAFEGFDAAGKWRTIEGGQAINTKSTILDGELAGPVEGAADLVSRIAASAAYKSCVAKQVFRYGMGRVETDDDAPVIADMSRGLGGDGNDIRKTFTALAASNVFRARKIEEAQ